MVEDATMDRRSWLWRRKSSEKSPGETDSSGSVSSRSERYYDDHEVLRASPNNASPNHIESPEVSFKVEDTQVHETVKSLTEKLLAAVLNINAKEELVKQHAKVAEEAIAGWEKAETEVVVLKKQLEVACQKNSALEDRIGHLDGALKECVRELRQSREEQEQKIHDAIIKRTRDWESEKFELENQLGHLHAQLEVAKADAASSLNHDLQVKLEAYEKENSALKVELLVQSKDLQKRTIERDLSIQAAEAASKQHLESIKKVTKLESECHRLLSIGRKTLVVNDNKGPNLVCIESVTDSHSDSGEWLLGLDNAAGCSDAWATALIAELDQFKNDKGSTRNLASSVDIELMDDFLEMERLLAMPDAENGSSRIQVETDTIEIPLKVTELELKVENLETEKIELELALADTRKQLEVSLNQLTMAESKLAELQRQLDLAEKSKQLAKLELVDANEKRKLVVSQLELSQSEVQKLSEKVSLLEAESIAKLESDRKVSESQLQSAYSEASKLSSMASILECKVEKEKALVAEYAAKVSKQEAERNSFESQLNLARIEVRELRELHDKVRLLESQVEEQRVLRVALVTKGEATETKKKALESQLEISNLEIRNLHDKVGLLEGKLDKERVFSSAFATKCQNLEEELLKRKREAELWYITRSNGELKINKEKELAAAAGKLAECQKTIASLTKHLQLLTSFDDPILEVETPKLNATSAKLLSEDAKQLQRSGTSAIADCSTSPVSPSS